MEYTPYQKQALRAKGMCNVVWKNMWYSEKELGYSCNDGMYYKIVIAKDQPDTEVKKIVLLHEVGHIYYGHIDQVDYKKELEDIKGIFKKYNKPYAMIRTYGGPMSFLNIVMDLEINSKLLTLTNCNYMKKQGIGICTPESFDIDVFDDFRSYYEPMIKRLPDTDEEAEALKEQIKQMLKGESSPLDDDTEGFPVPDWMKDIIDEIIDEVEDEIKKEIKEEGLGRTHEDDPSEGTTTVDDELDKIESKAASADKLAGYGHRVGASVFISENNDKNIKEFFSSIIKVDLSYRQDAMRHYNRGTRANADGLLYSSMRRKTSEAKRRLGVLIDVSGSMDARSLLLALSSLKSNTRCLDPQSVIVTWDTYKCEEFPITKVPSEVFAGGGTDMAAGIKYLSEKGFDDIVVYSDMQTDMDAVSDVLDKSKSTIYTILVCDNYTDRIKGLDSYLSRNKKVLKVAR